MPVVGDYRQIYAPRFFLKALNALSGDIADNIIDFEFTEDPQKMNLVTLRVADPTFAFTNDPRFQEGVGYEMRWGYLTDISAVERFVASQVMFNFPNADTMPVITLRASGFEKLMNLTGSPQNYGPVSSSAVAEAIAKRYSLKTAIKDSKDSRKQNRLQGANVTDFEYLASLAKKLSWEFFIADDTLHFQPFDFDKAPDIDLVFSYRDDASGTLLSFEPVFNKKPGLLGVTGTDARKAAVKAPDAPAEPVVVGTGNAQGEVCTKGLLYSEAEVLSSQASTQSLRASNTSATQTQNKRTPVRFASAEESDTLLQANAEALSTHLRLNAQKAQATFIGSPRLRARKVIRIYNVGPYSGNWLITGTTHRITPESGYVVTATLSKASDKTSANKKPAVAPAAAPPEPVVVGTGNAQGDVSTKGLLYSEDKR